MSKAENGLIMPAKPYHHEPSAAFLAKEKVAEILLDLDQFQGRHPIAGRLAQALLLRQVAADLAPVLLELMAAGAADPPFRRRRGDGRAS